MQLRGTSDIDNLQLKSIFQYNIACPISYSDWYFENCRKNTISTVIEDNGRIFSVLERTPYNLSVNDTSVNAEYISTVATLPEHRGKGYVRELISNALIDMKNKGSVICFSVPPSYKMFDKFGFRLTHRFNQYTVDVKNIPDFSMNCTVERVGINDDVITVFSGIYEKYMYDKNSYIVRTPQNWHLILDDLINNFSGNLALIRNIDSIPVGYVMYIIDGRKMHIYEAAYVNHNAYTSIMAYIRSHITQVDTVTIKAPEGDLAFLDFCDNRTAVGLYPFVTSRITDVKSALTIAASNGFTGKITIKVIDRLILENNTVFSVSENTAEIMPENEIADVICDVGTLTQLFMGFLSPKDAEKMNLLCGDINLLNTLFSKKDNFINMLLV